MAKKQKPVLDSALQELLDKNFWYIEKRISSKETLEHAHTQDVVYFLQQFLPDVDEGELYEQVALWRRQSEIDEENSTKERIAENQAIANRYKKTIDLFNHPENRSIDVIDEVKKVGIGLLRQKGEIVEYVNDKVKPY